MKRKKPLERRTPLTGGKGLRRTALERKESGGLRRSPLRAKPKKPKDDAELAAARSWWEAVTTGGKGPCVRCGSKRRVQGHHVISQQDIRRHCQGQGIDPADLLWRVENGMALCEQCHMNHEAAADRIPRALVRPQHLEFAHSLGLDHLIERYYPDATG